MTWQGRVLAVVLIVASSMSECRVPADATPFRIKIRSQEFNQCAAACGNRVAATDLAIFFVNDGFRGTQKADTLALVETCLADALRVSQETGFPGPGFWHARTVSSCPVVPGWGRAWGNASFVVGIGTQTYGVGYGSQHPQDAPETRGLACSRGQTFIGPLVSCATHLTARSSAIARDQAFDFAVATAFNPISNASFRVMAGDYNLTPSQLPSVFASSFTALATSSTFPSPSPTKKIDYVHVQNPNVTVQWPARYCSFSASSVSDHCYVDGSYD